MFSQTEWIKRFGKERKFKENYFLENSAIPYSIFFVHETIDALTTVDLNFRGTSR